MVSAEDRASKIKYKHRVLASRGIRRFVRKVNVEKDKFWSLLPSTKVIVCFVAVSVAALLVGAVIGASLVRIRNVGTIRAIGVEVYKDQSLTEVLHEISWGTLNPGNSTTRTIYVKNTGTTPVTLTMTDGSWVPTTANTVLALTWNRQNTVLNAGQSIQATLTLTAASNTGSLTAFNCDVTFTGSQ